MEEVHVEPQLLLVLLVEVPNGAASRLQFEVQ